MLLSEAVVFPERFRAACEEFLAQYWHDRRWEMEQEFGVMDLPPGEDVRRFMVADVLRQIAQAAAGETEHLERGEVYECCQTLCERLFAAPGIGAGYHIPQEFWEAPIGQVMARAFIWLEGDELITMSQAAEISGRSASALSQLVDRRKLTVYPDPDEPNPRRRNRVRRSEIEKLK